MAEPYFWYTLGYEFGMFDNKIHVMKMTFLHNFGDKSYAFKLCAFIQQNLLKDLEEDLTKLILKQYKTDFLPGYQDVMVKDIFRKINRPIYNDTTELSSVSFSRKVPKSYRSIFNDSIDFMSQYIQKINLLFYKNKNEPVNKIVNGLEKLSHVVKNTSIYDDHSD